MDAAARSRRAPGGASASYQIVERDRPRRHGRGLPRRPRRWPVHQGSRHQTGARRIRYGLCSGTLPQRAPDSGHARSSQHRAPAGRRHHRRRHSLPGHGVDRGHAHRLVLRRAQAFDHAAAAVVPPGVRGRAVRAPTSGHPSRHQAEQHSGHARRRAEAAGFRHRQNSGSSGGDADHAGPADDAGVRQPGADSRRAHHDGHRCVLARRRALPVADRPLPLSGGNAQSPRTVAGSLRDRTADGRARSCSKPRAGRAPAIGKNVTPEQISRYARRISGEAASPPGRRIWTTSC